MQTPRSATMSVALTVLSVSLATSGPRAQQKSLPAITGVWKLNVEASTNPSGPGGPQPAGARGATPGGEGGGGASSGGGGDEGGGRSVAARPAARSAWRKRAASMR